ncbi:MAG: hypothetical protein WC543_06010 [Candidatus Omnitrophota bacterium]
MTQAIKILDYIHSNGEIITAKGIMTALELSRGIVDKILSKFFKQQIINKSKRGVYCKNSLTDTFILKPKNTKHNAHLKNLTEQEKLTYETYCGMINRCLNVNAHNYKNYGARGITICDEWLDDFNVFVKDLGLRPSKNYCIDRLQNEKGYFKENCHWVTQQDSLKNKRKKPNKADFASNSQESKSEKL